MDNNLAMEPRRESGKFSRAMRAVVAVVLAMGCRERTRGAISIPGDRPAGVFTDSVQFCH